MQEVKQQLTDDTIYHRPPDLPVRLGDMNKEQLKSALFIILTHLRFRGSLCMSERDEHQRLIFKYDKGDTHARDRDN